ncbi:hypothetical protein JQ596_29260 [Bradyrhizobium manausense]|uniref:hypothetical protein n=1 Tax=Bradyrhizobium TaxID=374 RepID=UPI001BABE77B|nr:MULTISPECIES: hypothetical protein [Bradyrhizobium]MBR0829628.1 hypothetical protein [Bradyrhizobium manausense]UVO25251.1 hypothetical protein KUF59_21795 [Bradyrhizobium arachidis]
MGQQPCWRFSKSDPKASCHFVGNAIDGKNVAIELKVRPSGSLGIYSGELRVSRDKVGHEEFGWVQLDRVVVNLAPEIAPHVLEAAANGMRAALSGSAWQLTRTGADGIRKHFEANAETFGAAREVTVLDSATAVFRATQVVSPSSWMDSLTYLFRVQDAPLPVEFVRE